MSIIDIIRKYNNYLSTMKTGIKDIDSGKNLYYKEEGYEGLKTSIRACAEFLEDLQFIKQQMPTINPIPKGSYNDAPEGLKEITLKEWQTGMFHYCLYQSDSKQVRGDQTFDLRLFDVPNFDDKKLGYAIMNDWFDKEKGKNRPEAIIRFCRYGKDEDWKSFESRFAAQFAGDNS